MPMLGRQRPKSLKPTDRDTIYWDNEGVRRLGVRVRPDHPATYVLNYRPDSRSKERRIKIGLVDEMSLTEARKRAISYKAEIIDGVDPLQEKANKRDRLTFAEAFNRHKKEHFPFLSKDHARHRERIFERHFLKPLGTMILTEVKKGDIAPIITKLRQTRSHVVRDGKQIRAMQGGEQAAINAHRHLTAFLSWTYNQDLIQAHPYRGLKLPGKPARRQRVLEPSEIAALWRAAATLPPYWSQMFRMLIATGQRRREVSEMHWREIDLERENWTLPAHRVKNRTEHAVPISSLMREIIEKAPGRKDFLFESPIDRRSVHSFGNPTDKLREASKVANFKIHDFRHSMITHMTELNVPTRVIESVVNHRSGEISGISRVYNHYRFEREKRRALELWATYLRRVIAGLPTHDLDYERFQIDGLSQIRYLTVAKLT